MDVDLRKTQEEEAEKGEDQRTWKKKRGVCDCRGMKGERGAERLCHKVYLEFIVLAELQTPSLYSSSRHVCVGKYNMCAPFDAYL